MNGNRSRQLGDAERTEPSLKKLFRYIKTGKTTVDYQRRHQIFDQGSPADAIYFVQSGKVKITVISSAGKEAVLLIVPAGQFFGEGCLVGQAIRVNSATAMEHCTLVRLERASMFRALRQHQELAWEFLTAMLIRNIRLEEDLCDQLFNHSERRLARVLLKLAHLHQNVDRDAVKLPNLSHEVLAEMVGTTRPRITKFMNKFRKIGLLDYNGVLTVRPDLLSDVVLRD
jgi:CRP-like cAMP-binding protein